MAAASGDDGMELTDADYIVMAQKYAQAYKDLKDLKAPEELKVLQGESKEVEEAMIEEMREKRAIGIKLEQPTDKGGYLQMKEAKKVSWTAPKMEQAVDVWKGASLSEQDIVDALKQAHKL